MVVLEDGRCVYANTPSSSSAATRSRSWPRSSRCSSSSSSRASARRPSGAPACARSAGSSTPTYTLAMRRRDGDRVMLELAGVPLEIAGRRRQLVVVVRDITARRRAEDERERLLARSALLAEASALFDQSLDEERTLRQRRAAVRARPGRHVRGRARRLPGTGPARRSRWRATRRARARALAAEPLLDGSTADRPAGARCMRHGRASERRRGCARGRRR